MTTGSVWAVSMFKNEGDVADHVVRHLAEEHVDGIIVADNLSDDDTRERLAEVQARLRGQCQVVVVDDEEVGYYQSRKMTTLARRAHADFGAEWIIPFDADEIWYSRTSNRLAEMLRQQPPEVRVIGAPLWNHFPSSLDTKSDVPFEAIQWRQRNPGPLPKVCFRYTDTAVIEMGNHAVSNAGDTSLNVGVELRHFPYRSFEQFMRKARNGAEAYKATDMDPNIGAHWRSYGAILEAHGEDTLREVFQTYFWFLSPVDADMVLDPAPYLRWSRQ